MGAVEYSWLLYYNVISIAVSNGFLSFILVVIVLNSSPIEAMSGSSMILSNYDSSIVSNFDVKL